MGQGEKRISNRGDGQGRAVVLALATVACWSTVAAAFKLSLRSVSAPELVAGSSFFAVVFLLPLVFRQERSRGRAWAGRGGCAARARLGWWLRTGMLGFLNPFLYYLILFTAYDRLPARFAQPLNYTWPLVLSVLAVPFLGQRLDRRGVGGIFLGLTGVAVLSSDGRLDVAWPSLSGGLLALGSSVIWAVYWIGSRRMAEAEEQRGGDVPGAATRRAGFFGAGFIWMVLWLLITGGGTLIPWKNPVWWAGSAYVGLMEMALPFSLWSAAVAARDKTTGIALFIYLSPFISLIPIHFILGEPIPPTTVGGLAVLVLGIALQEATGSSRRNV